MHPPAAPAVLDFGAGDPAWWIKLQEEEEEGGD